MAETKKTPKQTTSKAKTGKQPVKTSASAKKTAGKAAKKNAGTRKTDTKKTTPKKAAPEKEKPFRRKSIAERTVDWKTGRTAAILGWLALIPLGLLIVFFRFFMIGYSFTVLVLLILSGILIFYNCVHLLSGSYPRQMRTVKRVFTIILCIGLLVCGITEAIVIKASFGDPKESCEYVVVLGAKVRHDGPSVSLMDRIHAAADYLEAHPDVTAIVSGGKGTDEPITEAACMYEELVALGVDPDRIWMEDKATSTWENLNFSLDLIEERTGTRPEKIGILSSEYHLFRASLFANACGVESVGIPAKTSIISQRINHFMREVAGIWHYILLGGKYDA